MMEWSVHFQSSCLRAEIDGGVYIILYRRPGWHLSWFPTAGDSNSYQRVEWLDGKKTLANAKASCRAHRATCGYAVAMSEG